MGKAAFLLHGWLSDHDDFKALIPHLQGRYERIELVSYPGHGPGDDYQNFKARETVAHVEREYRRVLEECGEADVIGFSMGGALAAYLAANYPVHKLVLLAPGNKYFNLKLPFSKVKFLLKTVYAYQRAVLAKDRESKKELRQKLRGVFQDDIAGLRVIRDKWLRSYIRSAFRNFKELVAYVNERIECIDCPCFFAWGKLDQLVPRESIDFLAGLCVNERKVVKVYDHLSHFLLHSPEREELVRDILDFLNEG